VESLPSQKMMFEEDPLRSAGFHALVLGAGYSFQRAVGRGPARRGMMDHDSSLMSIGNWPDDLLRRGDKRA